MEDDKSWRETKRSDGAWSTFLEGAVNKTVYVEVRSYHPPEPFRTARPALDTLRLIDFDDHSVICVTPSGNVSQIFSRKDIVSITCIESVKELRVPGPLLEELTSAYVIGKKVVFIKKLRDGTGITLKAARDIAEDVWKHGVEYRLEKKKDLEEGSDLYLICESCDEEVSKPYDVGDVCSCGGLFKLKEE